MLLMPRHEIQPLVLESEKECGLVDLRNNICIAIIRAYCVACFVLTFASPLVPFLNLKLYMLFAVCIRAYIQMVFSNTKINMHAFNYGS